MKNIQNYEDLANKCEEYETQYFGFGRLVLKKSLASLVESKLQVQIQNAKNYFTSLDLNEELKNKVNEKCENLLKFTLRKSNQSLENIFNDLDKYFHIPDNVLLPQDQVFENCVEESEIEELREELNKWKSNILALDAAQILMEKEVAEGEAIKKHLTRKEKQLSSALSGLNVILFTDEINDHIDS